MRGTLSGDVEAFLPEAVLEQGARNNPELLWRAAHTCRSPNCDITLFLRTDKRPGAMSPLPALQQVNSSLRYMRVRFSETRKVGMKMEPRTF
jgi:hypothetical protein